MPPQLEEDVFFDARTLKFLADFESKNAEDSFFDARTLKFLADFKKSKEPPVVETVEDYGPSPLDYTKEIGKGLAAGAVGTAGSFLSGAGSFLEKEVPGLMAEYLSWNPAARFLTGLKDEDLKTLSTAFIANAIGESGVSESLQSGGQYLKDVAQGPLGASPEFEDSWTRAISEGVSSTVPAMGAFAVGGPVGIAAFGGLTGYDSGYETAKQLGATEDDARMYGWLTGITTGVTEPIGASAAGVRILSRLNKASSGWIGKEIVKSSGGEALQEALQQIPLEVAQQMYVEERDFWDGAEAVGKAGLLGGIIGGIVGGVASAPAMLKARGRQLEFASEAEPSGLSVEPATMEEAAQVASDIGSTVEVESQQKLLDDFDQRKVAGQKDPVPNAQSFRDAGYGELTRKERRSVIDELETKRQEQYGPKQEQAATQAETKAKAKTQAAPGILTNEPSSLAEPAQPSAKASRVVEEGVADGVDAQLNPTNRPGSVGMPGVTPYRQTERMPMRLERPSGEVLSTSAVEVLDAMEAVIEATGGETPIRTGRFASKAYLGIYKVRPETIRLRTANDVSTAAHEMGHALAKRAFGKTSPPVTGKVKSELVQLGKDLYGETKPNGGYRSEGFAELVYHYLAEPDVLRKKAPNAAKWFDEFLGKNEAIARSIDVVKDRVVRWQEQGALERGRQSQVDEYAPKERFKRFKAKVVKIASRSEWTDALDPLRQVSEAATTKLGRPLKSSDDPYKLSSALRLTHGGIIEEFVHRGTFNADRTPSGKPLFAIKPIVGERNIRDFGVYLHARRVLALQRGERGPRDAGLSAADANQIVKELDNPRWQKAAQIVYDWNDAVLNYVAQISSSMAQLVNRVRKADPGFYLPLSREFTDSVNRAMEAGSGASAIKRLHGSGRRIKEPFTMMIRNAENLILAAHKQAAKEALVRLSNIEGMGHIIEKVPRNVVPAATRSVEELLESIKKAIGLDMAESLGEDSLQRMVTLFHRESRPKGQDPIITHWNGKTIDFYQVKSPELVDVIDTGLSRPIVVDPHKWPALSTLYEWTAAKPKRFFTAGTTGLRASFGLVTNPLRDTQTLYLNSRANGNGMQLMYSWAKGMMDAATGAAGKRSGWYTAYSRLAIGMGRRLGRDVDLAGVAARQLKQGKKALYADPRNWFSWFQEAIQFPESAPRIAEIRQVAKDLNWRPGKPMTLDQMVDLTLAGKQGTVDFSAAGKASAVLNETIPFFNAAIQGPRVSINSFARKPSRFVWRGLAAITVPTLLNWWWNKDEEWYTEQNDNERFLFWQTPVFDTVLRIPRAFEIGALFASLPEAMADSWYREDPEGMSRWFTTTFRSMSPDILPVIPREALEQAANWDSFWDRPIVNKGLEGDPPKEQFDDWTSRSAIKIGEIFNISPKRIDHAIKGIGGGVTSDVVDVLGLGPKGVEREKELADIPIVGRLFRRGGKLGTRPKSIDDLYDRLAEAYQRQRSKSNPETTKERSTRLMMEDAARAVSNLMYVRSYTAELDKRNMLTSEALGIAKDAIQQAKSGEIIRSRIKSQRKRTERQREFIKKARSEKAES